MSIPFSSTALPLPAGFRHLLEGLVLKVLRAQPTDVVAFAAQHFQTLLEQREGSSADPAARGSRLEDELLRQPTFQEPDEEEEEEAGGQVGSVVPTGTVRGTAPAPKTGVFEPKRASGTAAGTVIPPHKPSPRPQTPL